MQQPPIYTLPMPGMPQPGSQGAQYVTPPQQRGFWQRLVLNTGIVYLAGIGSGGLIGLVQGYRSSPSNGMKIKINSSLNGASKLGSGFGNTLGVLALMYSGFEYTVDEFMLPSLGLDRSINNEAIPIMAASLTGAFYKCTSNPKTIILAALIGGGAMATKSLAERFLPDDLNLAKLASDTFF